MLAIRKYFILLLTILFASNNAFAKTGATTQTDEEKIAAIDDILEDIIIYYENDKAWPRWEYANNKVAREKLIKVVELLVNQSEKCRTIIIEGAASPIGSDEYNKELAMRRAVILRKLILKFEGSDKLNILVRSVGEDWHTFTQHINNTYHKPNRDKVLEILNTKESNNEKERKLKALDKGRTWRVLVNNYMNTARNAAVIRIVEEEVITSEHSKFLQGKVKPVELILTDRIEYQQSESAKATKATKAATTTSQSVEPEQLRKPVFAFRSNLLIPAMNIGAELPIGTHWSIGADYYFPWAWPKKENKNCFEILAWGIEARYWFGRNRTVFDRLQGHSLGLYGYMGYYDFEYNYQGYQGEYANIGLDYTYAMAVGKKKSVHFEFSLGVGYIYSQARKYTVIESGAPLISDKITKKIGYFGPTKANISLVVPIFQKVKPNDKK